MFFLLLLFQAIEPDTTKVAEDLLQSLSLEQKVGQLLYARCDAYYRADDSEQAQQLVRQVTDLGIGGLCVFQGTPRDQKALIDRLQGFSQIPLWIAQDLEWGLAMRLERATQFPSMMAVGATRNPKYAYDLGLITAREAHVLGVHQAYAPVCDINNNPANPVIGIRSFGESPELVAELSRWVARGLSDGGLMATAKHFPGHGDTAVDSHLALPVLPFDRRRLDEVELVPFRRLIDDGVGSVMVGHLALPELDGLPASLSPKIGLGLLRGELGFKGLIVTDALRMKGIAANYDSGLAALLAVEAGADMLLMAEDLLQARRALLNAVASGRLTEVRIDESVRRILRAKAKWGLLNPKPKASIGATVALRRHRAVARSIARDAVTCLRNEGELLPLDEQQGRVLYISLSDGTDLTAGDAFGKALATHLTRAPDRLRLDQRSPQATFRSVTHTAQSADLVIVAFLHRASMSRLADLMDRLGTGHTPVILVSFGSPYLGGNWREPEVVLNCYGDASVMQEGAAAALFGKSAIRGKLPVTLPGRYAYGHGLHIPQSRLGKALPEEVGMDSAVLDAVDDLMEGAVVSGAFPGAAVAIGRNGMLAKLKGYGFYSALSQSRVTPDSIFDLASLTKVIATTPMVMQLYDRGRIELGDPVACYLPAFGQSGKEDVSLKHLLTHTAGLSPFYRFYAMGIEDKQTVLDFIFGDELLYEPGSRYRYSDLGMITMACLLEEVAGTSFDSYLAKELYAPLGMASTFFVPTGEGCSDPNFVPTEWDGSFRHRLIQGEVHDETSYVLGGVAGHAGLFSSARDLARFAFVLTNDGVWGKQRFFTSETLSLFTTRADTGSSSTRALGWDTRSLQGYSSAGSLFGPRSYGHTGFTGTSIWIDPDRRLFVILLSNRVNPTRANIEIRKIRPELADIVAGSIRDEQLSEQ